MGRYAEGNPASEFPLTTYRELPRRRGESRAPPQRPCVEISALKVAERGGQRNLGDIDVRKSNSAKGIDIELAYPRGVDRYLLDIGQHGHLLVAKTCISKVTMHCWRLSAPDHPRQRLEMHVQAVA